MIDPTAFIAPGAIVLGDVHLGVESSIWYNAVLRGDTDRITIGDQTNIQDLTMIHADVGVPCTVGCRVTVGHRVILHGCTIEDDCLIGMGAIVLNGAPYWPRLYRRGRGSGPGEHGSASRVDGDRRPARVRRDVDEMMRERMEHGWKHYVEQARRHRRETFPIRPHSRNG